MAIGHLGASAIRLVSGTVAPSGPTRSARPVELVISLLPSPGYRTDRADLNNGSDDPAPWGGLSRSLRRPELRRQDKFSYDTKGKIAKT